MNLNYEGKQILVVGLGKTGVGLCRFLAARHALVTATDSAPAAELAPALNALQGIDITLEIGCSRPAHLENFDLIVTSPGVPPELPWLQEAVSEGVPLVGELEIAGDYLHLPLAAISGTNGKTTTTTLVGEMLQASGRRPLVGGNIGTPLVDLVDLQVQADCLILEISSFQLDTAPSFKPNTAALLNITADHLDRYTDFQAYADSKALLFRQQNAQDLAVLNADDPLVAALAPKLKSRIYFYSSRKKLAAGAWKTDSNLIVHLTGSKNPAIDFPLADIALPGNHNLENLMAALLTALEMGATPDGCVEVLKNFQGLPHRLQWIASINGIDFFDDSKATNVDAVVRSLEHFNQPVVLIAGGRDKGGDYSPLFPWLRRKVKEVILLGEAREIMAAAFAGHVPLQIAIDMAHAVSLAFAAAGSGDVVLLSPACSSFDMFRDYAERGRIFQQAVRSLDHGRQNSSRRVA